MGMLLGLDEEPGTQGEDSRARLMPPNGAHLSLKVIELTEEEQEVSLRLPPTMVRTTSELPAASDQSDFGIRPGGPSILELLHADSQGPAASNEPKLRTVIASSEDGVLWPLGQ